MRVTVRPIVFLLLAVFLPAAAAAQGPTAPSRAMASRADLESSLQNSTGARRAAIAARLENGDFRAGDLIALSVIDESTLTDTFTVRSGQTLKLPNIPEFSLHGVLRSELQDFMSKKVAQYIRDPEVTAVALVRVALTGAVLRPGFYSVPAETPAAQVVMVAGGLASTASLQKVKVVRADSVVLTPQQMGAALAAGTSLDQLSIQGGDEFVIGEKSGGMRGALQVAGLLTGLASGIYFATRIF